MALAEPRAIPGIRASEQSAADEPSMSSAIEHLVTSSEGVITKRIDLALLEGQEFLSRTLRRAALAVMGMVLAAGGWFTLAACLVLLVTPGATAIVRLAIFGMLNASGAIGLVALAMRERSELAVRGASSQISGTTERGAWQPEGRK